MMLGLGTWELININSNSITLCRICVGFVNRVENLSYLCRIPKSCKKLTTLSEDSLSTI